MNRSGILIFSILVNVLVTVVWARPAGDPSSSRSVFFSCDVFGEFEHKKNDRILKVSQTVILVEANGTPAEFGAVEERQDPYDYRLETRPWRLYIKHKPIDRYRTGGTFTLELKAPIVSDRVWLFQTLAQVTFSDKETVMKGKFFYGSKDVSVMCLRLCNVEDYDEASRTPCLK